MIESFIVSSCFKSGARAYGTWYIQQFQLCACKFLQAGRKRAAFISGSNVSVVSINMIQWLKVSHKVFGSSKKMRKNLVVGRQDYTKELHG